MRGLWVVALASAAVLSPFSLVAQRAADVAPTRADTSRPAIPPRLNLPSDSTFTVEKPGRPRPELLYYRNIVGIIFDDTTSGARVRDLLARYGGIVIGGVSDEYIVRIPDPGATYAALDSVVTQLNSEPGVTLASRVYYRTPISLR